MKHTPEKRGKLRALDKPVYIFVFPVIFALLFTAFASYWEAYYRTKFPVWGCLFLLPLALLGIAMGYQLQMYPEEHLGKKAEMIVGIVIAEFGGCPLNAETPRSSVISYKRTASSQKPVERSAVPAWSR